MITFFWLAVAFCIVIYSFKVYAEITEDRPTDENIGKFGNHVWYDMRGKNLKEWKYEDHIPKPEPIVKAQNKPVEQRKEVKPKNDTFDINKLAKAVAKHETKDC